jgi:hypothetical protein
MITTEEWGGTTGNDGYLTIKFGSLTWRGERGRGEVQTCVCKKERSAKTQKFAQ